MPKIVSQERVLEYSTEFKVKIVQLTESLNVSTSEIANIMGLHPVMVYRWRQEYREGKLTYEPSRRILMSKSTKPPVTATENKELKRLQKENAKLKKENEFLKKWDAFLKEQRRKDSNS